MARPKKALDVALILKLHAKGLSARAIAKQVDVSRMTINRVLCHPPSFVPVLCHPTPNQKPSSLDVKCKDVEVSGTKPSTSDSLSSKNTPSASSVSATTTLGSGHRIAFGVSYEGEQPRSIRKAHIGRGKGSDAYLFEENGCTVKVYTTRIVVWPHGIKGNSSEEILGRARGRARSVLAEFKARYSLGMVLGDDTVKQLTEAEFNLEYGEVNDAVMEILKEAPEEAKKEGMLPGDTTHPGQVEFVGDVGRKRFDRLMQLLTEDTDKDKEIEKAKVKFLFDTVSTLAQAQSIYLKEDRLFKEQTEIRFGQVAEALKDVADVMQGKDIRPKMREN